MEYRIVHHKLQFIKAAKTSRNVFTTRDIRYVLLTENGVTGIGEAAPLYKLSIDDVDDYDIKLNEVCKQLCKNTSLLDIDLAKYPSIRFGLETAMQDLVNGGKRIPFDTPFVQGNSIPINGLVWMADLDDMYDEAIAKIGQGYSCIKFKVGQHDFDAECRFLERIRTLHNAFNLEIRLDANGAFLADEAAIQLKELRRFDIHSIEQPIHVNQWDDMARLCRDSKIDIALDEELIGIDVYEKGEALVNHIQPQYLILKPNLIGGFKVSDKWIELCEKHRLGWWATSALESNIGLNAIAQWVSQYETTMPQGLGTGSLYSNNIEGPLQIINRAIHYGQTKWDLSEIV